MLTQTMSLLSVTGENWFISATETGTRGSVTLLSVLLQIVVPLAVVLISSILSWKIAERKAEREVTRAAEEFTRKLEIERTKLLAVQRFPGYAALLSKTYRMSSECLRLRSVDPESITKCRKYLASYSELVFRTLALFSDDVADLIGGLFFGEMLPQFEEFETTPGEINDPAKWVKWTQVIFLFQLELIKSLRCELGFVVSDGDSFEKTFVAADRSR